MMSRKLGNSARALVAWAAYAGMPPTPQHLSEMESWDWTRYRDRSDITEMTSIMGEVAQVAGQSRLGVDSIDALDHFARQNLGATVLPEHLAARGGTDGALVRLLSEWRLVPLGYYAVWPDKSRREKLTLIFVRFLAEAGN